MAQANDSILVTPGTGATVATHLANAKEHQVVMVAGDDGHIRGSKDAYIANFKLATDAASSGLLFTNVANTNKQWATIYHTAAAAKTVKLRRVELYLAKSTVATVASFDLRRLTAATAPASGNPAITPMALNPASAAAEATCLALPTTAGSFTAGDALFTQEINLGILAALTNTYPPDPICLWPAEGDGMDEVTDLIMRPGVAEGYAVSVRCVAATSMTATVRMIFTEH